MIAAAPTRIAGLFALAAFAVAIVAGLASGNEAFSVLLRAIMALVVCYPVGLTVGFVVQGLMRQHVEEHERAHPAPEDASTADAGAEPAVPMEEDEEVIVA